MEPQNQQNQKYLRFIPLGGMGEVTKNMYVYETPNDIVVVDCGVGFPPEEEAQSENELLIPDFSYLLANQKVEAVTALEQAIKDFPEFKIEGENLIKQIGN